MKVQSKDNEVATFDVTGMSRRTFCALLATAGATMVAGTNGSLKAFADDGSVVAEVENAPFSAAALNSDLASAADDVLLGMFFDYSDEGANRFHNVLCTSTDGRLFEYLNTPYNEDQNPFADPSLIYKNGMFYIVANDNRRNGRFWPIVGCSKDLGNWTAPEGGQLVNENTGGWSGVEFAEKPFGMTEFDIVAPDAFVDDDGTVYMILSAGYYGAFHGDAENDKMVPYLVKFNEFSCDGPNQWHNDQGQYYPANLRMVAEPARKINLPGVASDDRIDGSLYKQDGVYYLSIKRDGVNNEIYRNTVLDVNGWKLVRDGLAMGTEGSFLVSFKNEWRMYTDKIASWPYEVVRPDGQHGDGQTGVRVTSTSGDMAGAWEDTQEVVAIDMNRNRIDIRHGAVLNITDEAASAVVRNLRSAKGWDNGPRAWFSDVFREDWGYDAIYYCADRGLLSGYAGTTLFGRDDKLTRAQLATILWRYDQPDAAATYVASATKSTTKMADVGDCQWYTGAANWAVEKKVINGSINLDGSKSFMPDTPVSFEQMVAIFANYIDPDAAEKSDLAVLDKFKDGAAVSSWARHSLAWGVTVGLVNGSNEPDGLYLFPDASSSRMRVAAVVFNAFDIGLLK